jgi:hypothetical protein
LFKRDDYLNATHGVMGREEEMAAAYNAASTNEIKLTCQIWATNEANEIGLSPAASTSRLL